jgi:hypothetical protein
MSRFYYAAIRKRLSVETSRIVAYRLGQSVIRGCLAETLVFFR